MARTNRTLVQAMKKAFEIVLHLFVAAFFLFGFAILYHKWRLDGGWLWLAAAIAYGLSFLGAFTFAFEDWSDEEVH